MARHRRGYLYKRGGIYQLEYSVGGKRVRQSLKVTDLKTAKQLRDKIMKPLEVADDVEVLQNVTRRLEGTKANLDYMERSETPPLKLREAWSTYLRSKKRPDTGDVTLGHYHGQFSRLLTWVQKVHPNLRFI